MNEQEDNALTLEGLAQKLHTQTLRLETLEHENAELRHKVATLESSGTHRDKLAQKRGSDTPRDGEPATEELAGRLSRRSLLSKAGAAAVAAAAAGTLLTQREAKADHYGPGIEVDYVRAHNLAAANNNVGSAVEGVSDVQSGVYGQSAGAAGIFAGVTGENIGNGPGVLGRSNNIGVYGFGETGVWGHFTQDSGEGVRGDGQGLRYAGVLGRNPTPGGWGVRGEGGTGVYGVSSVGVGVMGELTGGEGVAVFAKAVGSDKGLGGWFEGGRAQLRIKPKDSAGKPTNTPHSQGDLYMDSEAQLFVCTVAGTPGTWRKFVTVPT